MCVCANGVDEPKKTVILQTIDPSTYVEGVRSMAAYQRYLLPRLFASRSAQIYASDAPVGLYFFSVVEIV